MTTLQIQPKSSEKVKGETERKPPAPKTQKKRKTIEHRGDGKISYPPLRVEITLREVGPPVQTS